jgi:histidinol-phosphate aminotransferase
MPNPQSSNRDSQALIRPFLRAVHPYLPGEQPRIKGLIKLNTNENPYPPSPHVLKTMKAAVDGRLRLYPNPTAEPLREKLAKLHGCRAENIIVGNGSDELLALAVRCCVETLASQRGPLSQRYLVPPARATVQFFTPSYSLYPVLAAINGAASNSVPLGWEFALPEPALLRHNKQWQPKSALTFITTPNAPSGRGYATAQLEFLCAKSKGVVVLDEAYADFAGENALSLALKYPHVLVARTFSKAFSICFQRVGYFVGHPELITALHSIRDSYNVNGLGQIGAEATLDDLAYYRANIGKIIATREWLSGELAKLRFHVFPSQTNFLLAKPPGLTAEAWLQKLREHKILVRWFNALELRDYLRITIGTPAEVEALVKAARSIIG